MSACDKEDNLRHVQQESHKRGKPVRGRVAVMIQACDLLKLLCSLK